MTLEELGYKLIKKDSKYYYNEYIDLRGTKITSLPDNLTVDGRLNLYKTNITSLPDNLVVGEYLDLEKTNITTLPDNLVVGGSLILRDTDITTLPDNLTIGGSLILRDTDITTLPDNLTIGGDLDIYGTGITSLPDNLVVRGIIFFRNTKITKEEINKVNHNVPKVLFWKNKEYVKVIKGLFYKVLLNKGRSIYKVSRMRNNKIYYLITNGDCSKYIIEDNLEEAKRKFNLLNIEK